MKTGKLPRDIVWVRGGMLVAAIVFIGIGFAKQEHFAVMQKAVKICLECIGIG